MLVPHYTQRIIVLLLLIFLFSHTSGQPAFVLHDKSSGYRIDHEVEVFQDSSNNLTIEEITSGSFQPRFTRTGKDLKFGYLKDAIWLKVNLKAPSSDQEWMIEIPAPFLEYVDFYQRLPDSSWQTASSGYYRKQNERVIQHTGHVFPVIFQGHEATTIYIRIAGRSPKTFPLFVIEKDELFNKIRYEDLWYGIFFGILFVMFFYNLFIFVSLRHVNYLLYVFTIICTFLIFSSASGYGGMFLWPEHPAMNFYAGRMSLGLMAIVLSIFTIRFLEVKKYSRVMYYMLLSLIPLGVIANVLVLTETMSSAGNNLISLATVIYLLTGIVCRAKGNKTASFFIAAWTIYLTGGLLLTLRNSGVLDFNFWTTHFVEIGAALETIIIAFALGDRYRRYKREKEEAQAMALQLQLETNERLESKVEERTAQLSKALTELRNTLDENTRQTKIIEEKNNELDAFFYRISHDLKGPVTSLLALSSLAKKDVTDHLAHEYIGRQHQQVERLNHIITGLIHLTKTNDANLERKPIDFQSMVEECLNTFSASLPKFQQIAITKDIQVVEEYKSEWTLVNAIVQNLIENAIKYSNPTSPAIGVRIKENENEVVIEVADNGEGIPAEQQQKIFDMFYRATSTNTGSGLGLYILKRSVDRLKGTVTVKSAPGTGSVFTVTLPRQY